MVKTEIGEFNWNPKCNTDTQKVMWYITSPAELGISCPVDMYLYHLVRSRVSLPSPWFLFPLLHVPSNKHWLESCSLNKGKESNQQRSTLSNSWWGLLPLFFRDAAATLNSLYNYCLFYTSLKVATYKWCNIIK